MLFKASAPGSLMLLGEYAVLNNKLALVCAVDKRMTVTLSPRSDTQVTISSKLGEYSKEISQLAIEPPFQFVLATLKKFQKKLPSGCDIQINSEFSDKIGFASSAAVTVATLVVLAKWLGLPFANQNHPDDVDFRAQHLAKLKLARIARDIIREVQGLGSGADVAACVFGGIIAYRPKPLSIEKLPYVYPITVVYSGSKTPTVEVVTRVKKSFADTPELFKQICQAIDHCAERGRQAIYNQNWTDLGKIMNVQQGLMDALGVNTEHLNKIIHRLRAQPDIFGVKISGSGLGDCVIGLGNHDQGSLSFETGMFSIPVEVARQGVYCEEI